MAIFVESFVNAKPLNFRDFNDSHSIQLTGVRTLLSEFLGYLDFLSVYVSASTITHEVSAEDELTEITLSCAEILMLSSSLK